MNQICMNLEYFARSHLNIYQVALTVLQVVDESTSRAQIAYEVGEKFVRIYVVLSLNFLSNRIADFKGRNPNRFPISHGEMVEFSFTAT